MKINIEAKTNEERGYGETTSLEFSDEHEGYIILKIQGSNVYYSLPVEDMEWLKIMIEKHDKTK